MSKDFPPYDNSSGNIKVELDLTHYATKDDVKNITHVDVSSYASKTNLAALKIEVDKIDTDKLKTMPNDLVPNAVKNEVVKKTDYNTKIFNIETQITSVNKNALDNLADTKVLKTKTVETSNFVTRTKFSTDTNALDDKIDKVDKKIPDVSGLATKASLSSLLPVSTVNSKVKELEGKVTNVDNKFSGFVKKTDYGNETTKIKNDYATNVSVDSKLNNLKSQRISDKVKKVDDKTKKNASDILRFENRLKQKEDTVNENERGLSFARGLFFYVVKKYLVYGCKISSFNFSSNKISAWKSTGIFNYFDNSNINAAVYLVNDSPALENDGRMYVYFSGTYFAQKDIRNPNNNNVINIYCVYQLDPISSSRDTTFTVQNALLGAMQITKKF